MFWKLLLNLESTPAKLLEVLLSHTNTKNIMANERSTLNSLPVNFIALGEFLETLQEGQNHLKAQEVKIIDLDYKHYFRENSHTVLELYAFEIEYNPERHQNHEDLVKFIINEIGTRMTVSSVHFRWEGPCNILFTKVLSSKEY